MCTSTRCDGVLERGSSNSIGSERSTSPICRKSGAGCRGVETNVRTGLSFSRTGGVTRNDLQRPTRIRKFKRTVFRHDWFQFSLPVRSEAPDGFVFGVVRIPTFIAPELHPPAQLPLRQLPLTAASCRKLPNAVHPLLPVRSAPS